MIKSLLFFVLLITSTVSSAFNFTDYNGRCEDTKVVLGNVEDNKFAAAEYNEQESVITFDIYFVQRVSQPALTFVFFHECGHIVNQDEYSGYANIQDESRADCYAAQRFRKEYGTAQLKTVLDELLPINGGFRNNQIWTCK